MTICVVPSWAEFQSAARMIPITQQVNVTAVPRFPPSATRLAAASTDSYLGRRLIITSRISAVAGNELAQLWAKLPSQPPPRVHICACYCFPQWYPTSVMSPANMRRDQRLRPWTATHRNRKTGSGTRFTWLHFDQATASIPCVVGTEETWPWQSSGGFFFGPCKQSLTRQGF